MFAKILLINAVLAVNLVDSGFYTNLISHPINIIPEGIGNPLSSTSLDFFRGLAIRRRCPVCDPSVYSYCTDKLFHDSCCCHNPNNPYDQLPYQCSFADCSFLHSNTCQEHKLITACCCTNQLYYKK